MKACGKAKRENSGSRRAFSLLLALCVLAAGLPFAAPTAQAIDYIEGYKYALLTSDTVPGTRLMRECVYIVTPDPGQDTVTISGEDGVGAKLSALVGPERPNPDDKYSFGKAIIHIPEGVTLELQGGDGSLTYDAGSDYGVMVGAGGGAGLELPENSEVVLTGTGTLKATGGRGGSATPGEHGNSNYMRGGHGGSGAGGGGAGIGLRGEKGGFGGMGSSGPNTGDSGRDGYQPYHWNITYLTLFMEHHYNFATSKFEPSSPKVIAAGGLGGKASEGGKGYYNKNYDTCYTGGGGGGIGGAGAPIGTGGGGGGGGGGGCRSSEPTNGEPGNNEEGGIGGDGWELAGGRNITYCYPNHPPFHPEGYYTALPSDLYQNFTLQVRSGYGMGEVLTSVTHEDLPVGSKKQFTKEDLVLAFDPDQYNAALKKIRSDPSHFEHGVLEYIPPDENSPFFEEKPDGTIEYVAENLSDLLGNRTFFDRNGVWIHRGDTVLFQRATPILTVPFNPAGGTFTEDYLESTKNNSVDGNRYTMTDDGMLQFQFPYITHEVGLGSKIPLPGPGDVKRPGHVFEGWFGPQGNLTLHGTISDVIPNFGYVAPPHKYPAVARWKEAPTLTLESSQYLSPITSKLENLFVISASVIDADGSTRYLDSGDAVAPGTEVSVHARSLSSDYRFMPGTNTPPPGAAVAPGAVYGSYYQYTDGEGNRHNVLIDERSFTFTMPETDTRLYMDAENVPVQGRVKLGDYTWEAEVDYSGEPELHFNAAGLQNAVVSVETTNGSTSNVTCHVFEADYSGIIMNKPNYKGPFALSEKITQEGRYVIRTTLRNGFLDSSNIESPVIVYDNTAPVFSLPDGGTYDTAQTLTVLDGYSLASVKVNGAEQLSSDFTGTEKQLDLTEPGAYTVEATDKAGNTASISVKITEQLAVPGYVKWNASSPAKATWRAVEHAAGYLVQLYKDDQPLGEPVSVSGGGAQSHDFAGVIEAEGGGRYAFTVQAVGDNEIYFDSGESVKSSASRMGFRDFAVTGDESGYRYDVLNNVLLINEPGDYTIALAEGVTSTDHRIDIWATSGTVNLTLSNVKIQSQKQCIWFKNGTPADVVLTLLGENDLTSTGSTAIQKSGVSTDSCGALTFREHVDGGSLFVWGADHAVGGRVDEQNGSELYNVVFESGDITAYGARQAFGSVYTKEHTATGGNVNVRIVPAAGQEARLSFGDDAVIATPLEAPIMSRYQWTETANYVNLSYAEQEVVSMDVTWGSLEYTYQEPSPGVWNAVTHTYDAATEGGWSVDAENANRITVENTGNVDVAVSLRYNAASEYAGIVGAFDDGETPVTAPTPLAVGESKRFSCTLSGAPPKTTPTQQTVVGTVTVTIGGGNE